MHQIQIHHKIDALLNAGTEHCGCDDVFGLISVNADACQYFFATADERWLDWLWQNHFLDAIKQASDPSKSGERMPELSYLARMVRIVPEKVVEIMLSVPISPKTFNHYVVTSFLEICSRLPAPLMARMAPKILKENWVPLMGEFNRYGFEYEGIFEILANAGDYSNIIMLARAVLSMRPVDASETKQSASSNPFYFEFLSYFKVFKFLVTVSDEYAEQALGVVVKIMSAIVHAGGAPDHPSIFPINETRALLDVDFFTLELNQDEQGRGRDNIHNLASVVLILARRLIADQPDEQLARRIWVEYLSELPQNGSIWRLQLFILSIRPTLFKKELKDAFFRIFDAQDRRELLFGAEYTRALHKGFHVLTEADKQSYVLQAVELFSRPTEDTNERKWNIRHGSNIFSSILDCLNKNPNLKQQVQDAGFNLDADYNPKPVFGPIQSGFIQNQSPVTQEELAKQKILDIVENLKTIWAPDNLRQQNAPENIFNPISAEGVSSELKKNIPLRLQDYINNASLFFAPDILDLHYTYSFLRGIQDAIKNSKESVKTTNWDGLFNFCASICDKSRTNHMMQNVRENEACDTWLAGGSAIHLSMADVLMELLKVKNGAPVIDFQKYRDHIFALLTYLLEYHDPIPSGVELEKTKSKIQSSVSSDYLASDPFTIAINSVRGRAFEAFVSFVFLDSQQLAGENKKISDDVKELYLKLLGSENTRAIMFLFGHYLPSFYFRDKNWIKGLLPMIFPSESAKKALFTAALEGYLVNNLYSEIFFDPDIQKLYERAINLSETDYPQQKHFKAPDECLAEHLMLAYMHYDSFGFDHPLFSAFWRQNIPERHTDFINAIGRIFIAGNNAATGKFMQENPTAKERLQLLWDWMLKTYSSLHADAENSAVFKEFGWWITCEKDLFEPAWLAKHVRQTLEITKGELTWDLNLKKSLTCIANTAPADTLEIVRLYMLGGGVKVSNYHGLPPHVDAEWIDALQILYDRHETKDGTYKLIDDLIHYGGRAFWGLKKIVDK